MDKPMLSLQHRAGAVDRSEGAPLRSFVSALGFENCKNAPSRAAKGHEQCVKQKVWQSPYVYVYAYASIENTGAVVHVSLLRWTL